MVLGGRWRVCRVSLLLCISRQDELATVQLLYRSRVRPMYGRMQEELKMEKDFAYDDGCSENGKGDTSTEKTKPLTVTMYISRG